MSTRWSAEQAKTEPIFAALLEFHGRLHLLRDRPLPLSMPCPVELADAGARLRTKHVRGVENLLAALRASATRFETFQIALSDVHSSVCARHVATATSHEQQQRTWSTVGAGRGLDAQRVGLPAAEQWVEWIGELDAQYTRELLLKLELLDTLQLSMSREALQGTHRLWTLQPHLSLPSLERLRAVAQSLTLGDDDARNIS